MRKERCKITQERLYEEYNIKLLKQELYFFGLDMRYYLESKKIKINKYAKYLNTNYAYIKRCLKGECFFNMEMLMLSEELLELEKYSLGKKYFDIFYNAYDNLE